MNCKPGDLAMVVRGGALPAEAEIIGVVRRLTKCRPHKFSGNPVWEYEGEILAVSTGHITALADDVLQPIRGIEVPASIDQSIAEPA
ncbi:MAG: hypothetical protein JWP38_3715 [Herbaspirillum sp.]|nr:hypothetical protein [Herbaspirillum sp.]